MAEPSDLERLIFGGGDSDSDLSDAISDNELQTSLMAVSSSQQAAGILESEADRKKRKQEKKAKRLLRKQRRQRDAEVRAQEAGNEPPIDPSLQEFENVVQSMKNKRSRVEFDEMGMDEIIVRLCDEMKMAASDDVEANTKKKPATAKLKMMSRVMALVEKSYLHEQLLEHELLQVLRIWLEPLPDGSLPSIAIRKPIFQLLAKLPIETEHLRESRVGRVIMFYYKCERELPELRKQAADLIVQWSKPILQSVNRIVNSVPRHEPTSRDGRSADDEDRNRVGDLGYVPKTARIPQAVCTTYTNAPVANLEEYHREKVTVENNLYKRIQTNMRNKKKK